MSVCSSHQIVFLLVEIQHTQSPRWLNGVSGWNVWETAIGERGQLEVKDEKENMALVDKVATAVVQVYGAVCQLCFKT